MIFKYIERIKKFPKDVRKTYAIILTSVITGVVVCIYLIALFLGSLGTRAPTEDAQGTEVSLRKEIDSIKQLFDASNVFKDEDWQGENIQSATRTNQYEPQQNVYDWEAVMLDGEWSTESNTPDALNAGGFTEATSTATTSGVREL